MTSAIRSALVVGGLLVGFAGAASAQTLDRMTFTTSFPFVAAGQTLPAGTYNVESVSGAPASVALTDAQHRVVVMEVDAAGSPQSAGRVEAEVVFTKLEDGNYALDQIWSAPNQAGVEVAWAALHASGESVSSGAGPARRIVPAQSGHRR